MIKYGVKYADKNDGRTYYVTDDYSVSTNPLDAASFTSRDELKDAAYKTLVENEYMIDESHFRTYWSVGRIRGFAFDDDGRINLNQSRKPVKSAARPSYTIRGEELHEGDSVYVKSEDKYGTVNLLNGNMVDIVCDDGTKLDDIWADDCEIIKSKQDKEWECDDFMMNSLKRKSIKSGWTFRNAVNAFRGESGRFNDYWEMQQAWEAFKDGLARNGEITQRQSDNWGNPCTPETFARWNGKEESEEDIYSSKKSIKSGYNSWEDFYRKGCKLGLNKYMDKLDELHDKYGAFKKVPKEELSGILKSIPDNDEDVYHFTDEMFDYFDWYDIINSSKKPIKSAVDGGWEVDSSDAPKALQMWVDYVGEDNALEDLAQATGDDNLEEDIEWIARQFGVAEELEDLDSTWEKHEELRDLIGVHEYFENLHHAMGYDELAACLAFIFRQNDFQEWDDENGIYQSKGLRNLANVHMLYS